VDHPGQGIADGSCHDEREQRVTRCVPGHKALALTNIALSLRVTLACLPHIALAPAIHSPGCVSGTPGDIVERLSDLLKNVLGGILLWTDFLVQA